MTDQMRIFLDCLALFIAELSSHELIKEEDVPKFLETFFPELNGTPIEIIYTKGKKGIAMIQNMIENHDVGWLYQMREVA